MHNRMLANQSRPNKMRRMTADGAILRAAVLPLDRKGRVAMLANHIALIGLNGSSDSDSASLSGSGGLISRLQRCHSWRQP
jgi:hypothetical protein